MTIKTTNNTHYRYFDVGLDDPERAARNRLMVKNKEFTTAYQIVERYLTHTPLKTALPSWVPQDELVHVGKEDWGQHGGGRAGFTEELDPAVVDDLT